MDYGPDRDTDVLVLRNKKKEHAVHFAAYSIAKGELNVGQVRDAAAKKMGAGDPKGVKLLYKGRNLKDDERTCRQEGLRDGSEVLCSIADVPPQSPSESEDDEFDDGVEDGSALAVDGDGVKRRRNRGKRSKRRNRREAASGTSTPDQYSNPNPNLGVPLSQTSTRTASPSSRPAPPPTSQPPPPSSPATPLDKLNALHATLGSFIRECEAFKRNPPADPAKKQFEHKRLSETILTQVLLKLDAVETEGDVEARGRRKELVRETQGVLNELDAFVKQ